MQVDMEAARSVVVLSGYGAGFLMVLASMATLIDSSHRKIKVVNLTTGLCFAASFLAYGWVTSVI